MKEASFFRRKDNGIVQCHLCPHHCSVKPGAYGKCGVRKNSDGTLYSMNYRECVAQSPDPIEKKPLYHFLPGSRAFSIAAAGCNFTCGFCQNWNISQLRYERFNHRMKPVEPRKIIDGAIATDCESIAYTYTEPTIYYEFMIETARLAVENGLKNVMVSNGFIDPEPLDELLPLMHAFNIDLKSFSDTFYRKVCGGRLQPVLDTIGRIKKAGRWVEVTTLLIPQHNDSFEEVSEIAAFIAGIDVSIPWHVSRFFPAYHFDHMATATSESSLEQALNAARHYGLHYYYAGNTLHDTDTRCPECPNVVIERSGYTTRLPEQFNGTCPECGYEIAGVWSKDR